MAYILVDEGVWWECDSVPVAWGIMFGIDLLSFVNEVVERG